MKAITLHADDMILGPFQDEFGHIGNSKKIQIDDKLYTVDFPNFHSWLKQTRKYSPYSNPKGFTTDGLEEWINQGYNYAIMLRRLLPSHIDVYYGFWKDFGDGTWRFCKTQIP